LEQFSYEINKLHPTASDIYNEIATQFIVRISAIYPTKIGYHHPSVTAKGKIRRPSKATDIDRPQYLFTDSHSRLLYPTYHRNAELVIGDLSW
jgi:hypothetical protein